MLVTKLGLRNWKNFKRIEVQLGLRSFVIGPNAAGKSNLLDSLRFLRELSRDGLRKAIDEARGGVSAVRCLAARQHSTIEFHVEVRAEADSTESSWSYELGITQDNNRRAQVAFERVRNGSKLVLDRPNVEDQRDPQLLSQTALEQISANREFRPLSEFFGQISYQHILPQVVRDPRGFSSVPVRNDPFGRDFLLRIWQTSEKTRNSRLRKIGHVLKAAVPQLVELEAYMDESGVPHLKGGYAHWRPKAAKQTEDQFSDGTLRLLGLLWAMFEGDGPILLEEPEISLHPEVVKLLPRLFHSIQKQRKSSRQTVISTHSDDLLSDPSIGFGEVVRLEPGSEGTTIALPSKSDVAALSSGLSVADVLLPQAAPKSLSQLSFDFDVN